MVTTDSGKVALKVDRVEGSEGRKASRFNPVGQRRQGDGQQDQADGGAVDRPG